MSRVCNFCPRKNLTDADFYSTRNICKQCAIKRNNSRSKARSANGQCVDCPATISAGVRCVTCKAANLARYHAKREANLVVAKARRQRVKLAAFNAYGGAKCSCCGEKHVEFLTIDHVDGGGAEHRRTLASELGWKASSTGMTGYHFYSWLAKQGFPPGFQVLCFNCNFSLGHFGYCPHSQAKKAPATADKPSRRSNLHLENTANA